MTYKTHLVFALWLVFVGIVGSPQPCSADTPVTLKGRTEVHRMAVRLSDVFDGVPAEIDRDIAQAPAPGKEVTYDVNVLMRVAQKYRLDWEPQSLADHAVISTPCTRITTDTIREAVIQKARESEGFVATKDSAVDVVFDNHALEVDLPADQAPDFTLNNFAYDPVNKFFHTDLVADTSSGPFSVPVTGHLIIKISVPVLSHRLEGGTTISANDLEWIQVSEDRVHTSIVTNEHDLIGRELRRDTNGGELLSTHDVIPPRFVVRGSLVTLQIETPYMFLAVQGKALQDGGKNDVVRVMNMQSNRVIEGTVAGPGTVVVHTIGEKMAAAQ